MTTVLVGRIDAGFDGAQAERRRWHHPTVRRGRRGWWWACPCGASGCRSGARARWRVAYVQALAHAGSTTH